MPGRHSGDNIIITQEVVHSMRRKKGKKGWMVIKIDLEKAYDRVCWDFILDTLNDMQLPKEFSSMVYSCIYTVKTRVFLNGEIL